jgi:hypothetical protein
VLGVEVRRYSVPCYDTEFSHGIPRTEAIHLFQNEGKKSDSTVKISKRPTSIRKLM